MMASAIAAVSKYQIVGGEGSLTCPSSNTLVIAPIDVNLRNIEVINLGYKNFYIYGQSSGASK